MNMKIRKFSPDTIERRLHGLEEIWEGDASYRLEEIGLPADLKPNALGSIGGGNHFAEILQINDIVDDKLFSESGADKAFVHLMVHSGSRGLGGAILEQHLAKHNVLGFLANGQDCKNYLIQHDQAIKWAILNRTIIAERFFDCMNTDGERLLDICHNSVTPYRDGWLHRKGAAPSDNGMIVIPGSRGDLTYIVLPKLENAEIALHSLAHGAGRKWSRTEARDKLSRRYTIEEMTRTKLGSRVICEDKQLIYEEAPQAYKDITQVVKDLVDANLIDVVATMKPLITYKTRR
jgi:release factor H-coupled RctB family protein